MNEIGISEQKKATIAELLEKNVYYSVPIFQREYSWKNDELSDLFDDVQRSIKDDSQHFFGFMMVKPDGSNYVHIIEGQQRLATVTILICLVRDMLYKMGNDLYKDIDHKYIKTVDIFKRDTPPKLKVSLSKINQEFFKDLIQKIDSPENKLDIINNEKNMHQSNRLLCNAYKYFLNEFKSKIQNLVERNKIKYLTKILETILTKFVVITTEVNDNKTAYNIFQTLNDRGLDLALADLLKVYLFDLAGNDVKTAKENWDEVISILGNINLNNFLRHYWVSKYEVINQKYLMNEFEKKIKSKKDVFDFLNDLKFEAEIYESILNRSTDMWSKEVVTLINELFILTKNMLLPLLLGAFQNLKDKDLKKFLNICIAFIFRYVTIAERENKDLESHFSKLSINIRNGQINSIDSIKGKLGRLYVDDQTFKSIFITKDIKTAKVARYILQKIELHLDPLQEKFSEKITLEHILPKSLNNEWEKYLEKENMIKDDYVNKIGNMTLLLSPVNKKAQNKFYSEKRDLFYSKMTNLHINKELAKITSWNKKDIFDRQLKFAELAKNIWKI